MGKIIARVRRREDRAEAKRAFDASPLGRILAHDAANPGKTIKFRRWTPPAWASPIPDNLPPNTLVSVNAEGTGYVGTEPPKQP